MGCESSIVYGEISNVSHRRALGHSRHSSAFFLFPPHVGVDEFPLVLPDFVRKQLVHSSMARPKYFDRWVNLRKIFQDFYGLKERVKLTLMLAFQGMEFEGREHSGISDARNIARIARKMIQDGCTLKPNGGVNWHGMDVPCLLPDLFADLFFPFWI